MIFEFRSHEDTPFGAYNRYHRNNKNEIQIVRNFLQTFAQQQKNFNNHAIFDFQNLTKLYVTYIICASNVPILLC